MKTVNTIFYLPGYAGMFLKLILSLDKKTYPYLPFEADLADDRKDWYSFNSLRDPNKLWLSHHCNFHWSNDFFEKDEYSILVTGIHPKDFVNKRTNMGFPAGTKVNYLSVHASPEIELEHIEGFRNRNNGFPIISDEDVTIFNELVSTYDTFRINLDMFFSSESDFVTEYVRICNHLSIEPIVADALVMYRDWRETRNVTRTHESIENPKVINEIIDLLNTQCDKNGLYTKPYKI